MNTEFEQELFLPEDTEDLPQIYRAPRPAQRPHHKLPKNNSRSAMYISFGLLAAIVVCVVIGIILFRCAATKYISAIGDGYRQASNTVAEETYQRFYESSYNTAQAQNHVKNQVSISVGSLREEAKLQVLKVQDIEYSFGTLSTKEEKWLRVTGSAVFTVNLKVSEFLIDDVRQYVHVYIPEPEAGSFTLKTTENISPEQSKSFVSQLTGIFVGDRADEESNLYNKLRAEAYAKLQNEVSSSPYFYQVAKDNAIITVSNFVKSLNPDIPELKVDVEFFE